MSRDDLIRYYQMTKGSDLNLYNAEDLFVVLKNKLYTDLSYEVMEALVSTLSANRMFKQQKERGIERPSGGWSVHIRNYDTSDYDLYFFGVINDINFDALTEQDYKEFYSNYMCGLQEEYWNQIIKLKIMHTNGKIGQFEHTSPLSYVKHIQNTMDKNIYFYLGKKDTDVILEEFYGEFFRRFELCEYRSQHTQEDIDECKKRLDENYRLVRNKTKLNKHMKERI